jgi:hypothetical protein
LGELFSRAFVAIEVVDLVGDDFFGKPECFRVCIYFWVLRKALMSVGSLRTILILGFRAIMFLAMGFSFTKYLRV